MQAWHESEVCMFTEGFAIEAFLLLAEVVAGV